jgi:hypothetical protein
MFHTGQASCSPNRGTECDLSYELGVTPFIFWLMDDHLVSPHRSAVPDIVRCPRGRSRFRFRVGTISSLRAMSHLASCFFPTLQHSVTSKWCSTADYSILGCILGHSNYFASSLQAIITQRSYTIISPRIESLNIGIARYNFMQDRT